MAQSCPEALIEPVGMDCVTDVLFAAAVVIMDAPQALMLCEDKKEVN